MDSSFSPVAYEYREAIAEAIANQKSGKVFFWSEAQQVDEAVGTITGQVEIQGKGIFITFDSEAQVRIDRIITLFGKPGAAYDEYDSFANQCLSCTAGVPL